MALTREEFAQLRQQGFSIQQIADVDSRDTMENSSPNTRTAALDTRTDMPSSERFAQARLRVAQEGRPNLAKSLWKDIAENGVYTTDPMKMAGRGLMAAGAAGQTEESAIAGPILAAMQKRNIGKGFTDAVAGDTPVEYGDIGRQLDLPEPVNILGGLALSTIINPISGGMKTAGKVGSSMLRAFGKEAAADAAEKFAARRGVGLTDLVYKLNSNLGEGIGNKFEKKVGEMAESHLKSIDVDPRAAEDFVAQRGMTNPLTGKREAIISESHGTKGVQAADKRFARTYDSVVEGIKGKYNAFKTKFRNSVIDNDIVSMITEAPTSKLQLSKRWETTMEKVGKDQGEFSHIVGLKKTKDGWAGDGAELQNLIDEINRTGVNKTETTWDDVDRWTQKASNIAGTAGMDSEVIGAAQELSKNLRAVKDTVGNHAELSDMWHQFQKLGRGEIDASQLGKGEEFITPLDQIDISGTPSKASGRFLNRGSYSIESKAPETINALKEFQAFGEKHFPNLMESDLMKDYQKMSLLKAVSSEKAFKTPSIAAFLTFAVRNPAMLAGLVAMEKMFTPSKSARMWQSIFKKQAQWRAVLKQPRAQALESLLNLGVSGIEVRGMRELSSDSAKQ